MHRYLISICALCVIILAVLSFTSTPQAALESENKSIDLPVSPSSLIETNQAHIASSASKEMPMPAFLAAPQLPNRQNVALTSNGGVATASSTASPSEGLGNYEPLSAINGERAGAGTGASFSNNTFWRDGTADVYPDWWQVNFQGHKTIDEIDVYTLQDNYTNPSEPTEAMTFTLATVSSVHVSGNYPVAAVNNGDRKAMNWGSGGGWNDNTQGDTSSDIVQINFPAFNFLSEIDVFTLRDNFQDNQTPPTLSDTFNTCENSGNGITHFEVQYWTGSMWVTIPGGVVRENNKVWRQFVFPEVWASAVRVQVHGRS